MIARNDGLMCPSLRLLGDIKVREVACLLPVVWTGREFAGVRHR